MSERDSLLEQVELAQRLAKKLSMDSLSRYKPYPKQIEFHNASKEHRERLFLAGNQLGKTLAGSYEAAFHLTGRYPPWYEGRKFKKPTNAFCGGKDRIIHRDAAQRLLLGPIEEEGGLGTGAIPGDTIIKVAKSGGLTDTVDFVTVKHVSGGQSRIVFKTYDQRRAAWQGPTLDFVWFDEEPPSDIFTEGLTRTNTTLGPVFITFTPLLGMSEVVTQFLVSPSIQKHTTTMTIHDVDHYTDKERQIIIESYPPHERDARVRGIPMLGSGRVFPIAEDIITRPDREIPAHWSQINGLDFGWEHPFAAVNIAWDRDKDALWVTKCYRKKEAVPIVHVAAVKPWGSWIPCAWPHDGYQHDQGSGMQVREQFDGHGLNMHYEHSTHQEGGFGTEAGVMEILTRMQTSRFFVFESCTDWFEEFRLYHRNKGKIVKDRDDLMSATRQAVMMLRIAKTKPLATKSLKYEDGIYA